MSDYLAAIQTESARFSQLIRDTSAATPVPSCPGWSVADLTWHLLEVQHFWACIVADLLDSPEGVQVPERPVAAELPGLFDQQTARLVDALRSHQPEDVCWGWHDAGHSVGWVLRRQAHEALIHRVDAELASGGSFDMDSSLAADGVDEILRVMLDSSNLPEWSSFVPDGSTASIVAEEGSSWTVRMGRFRGTSPISGNSYDDPALQLVTKIHEPTVVVRGSSIDLDLWLWGRGSLDSLEVGGDADVAARIRAVAIQATQ